MEDYVRQLIERDGLAGEVGGPAVDADHQSAEDWIRDFKAVFSSLPAINPNFDDSRESIYPVR